MATMSSALDLAFAPGNPGKTLHGSHLGFYCEPHRGWHGGVIVR